MNTIKIAATGLFNVEALFKWLGARFPIEVIDAEDYQKADFLLCDTLNDKHENFKGVKILYTGENHHCDLNRFDYCLTHDYGESDRCHRFPYWQYGLLLSQESRHELTGGRRPLTVEELTAQNRDFCAFVSYNAAARKRVRFVKKLMARRKVSCGGPLMNNVGGPVEDKLGFCSGCLFTIAFENEAYPGYQTEKIVHAFLARSIPLYWGNQKVEEEFNPKAFVHERHFRSEEEMIDYVLELADNPERVVAMLNEPVFRDPGVIEKAEVELEAFFRRIFERGPGAIQRTRGQKIMAWLSNWYGHGFFRNLRRISRKIRGKKNRYK